MDTFIYGIDFGTTFTAAAVARAGQVRVSTEELDDVAARVLRQHGARSAPNLVYDFPGTACISVNDEAVHGVAVRPGHPVVLGAVDGTLG